MTDSMPILNPWVIVHQPEGPGTDMLTLLAGEPGATHKEFGLVIADIIGHVAQAFNVDEADVMDWVNRELHNRTTAITRVGPQ